MTERLFVSVHRRQGAVIIVAVCSSHADVAAAVVVTIASLASWLVVHVNVPV